MSKLILVGGGPGDPDLITIKGLNWLKKADVVLYDELIPRQLLDYCSPYCQLIYVGKKAGIHRYQQIYINDMIVDFGRKYQNIVRFKGGDPFVFGRGYEEIEHAKAHGMEVEVVPGISSSIAVPATNGIPLTKRGVNESFWVVTGTLSSGTFSNDMHEAARSSATIVILMGMKNLQSIVEMIRLFRGDEEPIAIMQNGCRENQKSVFGTLGDILDKVREQGIGSPAIITIGEVVKCGRESLIRLSDQIAV